MTGRSYLLDGQQWVGPIGTATIKWNMVWNLSKPYPYMYGSSVYTAFTGPLPSFAGHWVYPGTPTGLGVGSPNDCGAHTVVLATLGMSGEGYPTLPAANCSVSKMLLIQG
ncbi:MAG TPA: hypothetical protein VIM19_15395 [Actinomycetes bacterium]